jgi:outer membrane protein assembly factor BamA
VQSSPEPFERDRADAAAAFAGDPVFATETQPTFVTAEVSVAADSRDFPGHPLRGGVIHLSAARYSDRSTGAGDPRPSASFGRYEAEAAQFIPLAGSRVVLGAHGRLVSSRTGENRFVPFYLQPTLGGHDSLRSYADFRFHDRHLALINVEARFALMTHVDAALFADAGNVAARAADLNLAKRSYGAGLRLHSRHLTFVRLDVARGAEGWRMVVRLTDPLLLARPRRSAVLLPVLR